jgi:hypothetical protein
MQPNRLNFGQTIACRKPVGNIARVLVAFMEIFIFLCSYLLLVMAIAVSST